MALVLKTIEVDESGANKIRGSKEVGDYWQKLYKQILLSLHVILIITAQYLSPCGRKVPCYHVQRGCLPSSVWSEKSKDFSSLYTKEQVFDNCFRFLAGVESLPQPLNNTI